MLLLGVVLVFISIYLIYQGTVCNNNHLKECRFCHNCCFSKQIGNCASTQTKLFTSEMCCEEGCGSMCVICDYNAFRNIFNFEFSMTTEVVAFSHRKGVDCGGGLSSGGLLVWPFTENLGRIFHCSFKCDRQIKPIAKRGFFQLSPMSVKPSMPQIVVGNHNSALITSHLDHCNTLYDGYFTVSLNCGCWAANCWPCFTVFQCLLESFPKVFFCFKMG